MKVLFFLSSVCFYSRYLFNVVFQELPNYAWINTCVLFNRIYFNNDNFIDLAEFKANEKNISRNYIAVYYFLDHCKSYIRTPEWIIHYDSRHFANNYHGICKTLYNVIGNRIQSIFNLNQFWVLIAFIIYYTGTLLVIISRGVLLQYPREILFLVTSIDWSLKIFFNILFAVGFLCPQIQKEY